MRNKLRMISCIVMLSVILGGCSLFRKFNVTELGAPLVKTYAASVDTLLTGDGIENEFLSVYKSSYDIEGYVMTGTKAGNIAWILYGSEDIGIIGSGLNCRIENILQKDENVFAASELTDGVFVIATDNGSDAWGAPVRLIIYDCANLRLVANSVIEETSGDGFSGMCTDGSGNIYVVAGSKITKLGNDLSVKSSATLSDYYFDSVCCKDGALYLTSYSDSGSGLNIVKLKSEGLSVERVYSITADSNNDSLKFIGQDSDSVYLIKNDRFLMRFSATNDSLIQIANLDEYRIVTSDRSIVYNNGQFLIYGEYRGADGLFALKLGDEIVGRTEIELAVIGVTDKWLDRRIADFNADNRKYHLTVKYYTDSTIPDSVYCTTDAERLMLDLSSGNVPDMICTGKLYASVIKHSGMLMNLHDCADLNDSQYLTSVWNGMKEQDGTMLLAAPFFRISGFAGKSGDILSCKSEHVIRHDDAKTLTDALVNRLLTLDTYSSEKLYSYMEFIDNHKTLTYTENMSVASQIRSGDLGFIDCEAGGFGNYLLLCEYFGGAPEMALPIVNCDMFFGVFENTDCREGVKQFLEYCFSDDALSDDAANVMSRTPVSKAVIENIIGMTTKAYNDSQIKPGEASVNGVYQQDALLIYSDKEVSDAGLKVVQEINDMEQGKEVDHTPLSPGDLRKFSADEVSKLADSYRALLNNKAALYLPSHYMSDIAYPIIDKYCAGDISADNAAKEIDNAIRKYISEQN